MLVVDLFCGMGGMSLGFRQAGFTTYGYDQDPHAIASYTANVGPAFVWDAEEGLPAAVRPAVLVGGPPCRPWSPVNLQRRRHMHRDYHLLRVFDRAVLTYQPAVFVMENVPFVKRDDQFVQLVAALEAEYTVHVGTYRYSEWGAASSRTRLFAIGTRRDSGPSLQMILDGLERRRRMPRTVRQAIGRFRSLSRGSASDHEWGILRTIQRYAEKYESGQFGWYQLSWDRPAPSFGNVMKTYTLHPGGGTGEVRVVSPREVLALLGFTLRYAFPESVPRTAKYRMAADAVSPVFGRALAESIKEAISEASAEIPLAAPVA